MAETQTIEKDLLVLSDFEETATNLPDGPGR